MESRATEKEKKRLRTIRLSLSLSLLVWFFRCPNEILHIDRDWKKQMKTIWSIRVQFSWKIWIYLFRRDSKTLKYQFQTHLPELLTNRCSCTSSDRMHFIQCTFFSVFLFVFLFLSFVCFSSASYSVLVLCSLLFVSFIWPQRIKIVRFDLAFDSVFQVNCGLDRKMNIMMSHFRWTIGCFCVHMNIEPKCSSSSSTFDHGNF